LSIPDAPHKIPTVKPKSCGRVLTSQEMITEKAEAKRQAEVKKKTRKRS